MWYARDMINSAANEHGRQIDTAARKKNTIHGCGVCRQQLIRLHIAIIWLMGSALLTSNTQHELEPSTGTLL